MDELWWPDVTIYALADDGFVDEARTLFEHLALEGYGKRRSAGYGAVRSLEVEEFGGFDPPVDATGFVSLSSFVPGPGDPVDGFWQVSVKYGRLGEEYAYGPNPFKRPLLMLAAGSAFFDSPVRRFYGTLVEGVSPAHPEVVHYGYALPVAAKLPEEGSGGA
jgi:CRISPR-associated protein Csm4